MPDPLAVALIAAIGGVIGGVITAIAQPWGQDYVSRKAEERAADRDAAAQRVHRIGRVIEILAMSGSDGPYTYSAEKGARELPATAAAVNDAALSDAVDRMRARAGSAEWTRARADATKRAGTLLGQAEGDARRARQ